MHKLLTNFLVLALGLSIALPASGTISSATSRLDYTGNGAVDTYAYTFKIFANTDLQVTVRDDDDDETTLTLTTHYTVTGVGTASGGNVVLVNGSFDWLDADGDLKSGYVLTIKRVRPVTQTTSIRNQSAYYAATHENAFDHQVMLVQQQQDDISRSVKLPTTVSSSDVDPTLPVPSAGKSIKWNADADEWEAYDPTTAPGASFPASNGIAVYTGSSTLISRTLTAGSGLAVTNGSGVSGDPTVAIDTAAVTATHLGTDSVAADEIAAGAVGQGEIATDGVASAEIEASAVGIHELGPTSVAADDALNLGITATVGSNAMTIALKTAAGADASSSDPIKIGFRNATVTTGTPSIRSVTGALSIVVSSGSTLGHVSAVAENIYVYAIDNAGTVELAVATNNFLDSGGVISTTAEGGAGAADSRSTYYSTTARTNVAARLIGRITSTQATAGTYATSPSEVAIFPFKFGQVVSNSTQMIRTEFAVVDSACSASPCTIARQSGSWLTSIVRNAQGDYTMNIVAGTFSAAPACVIQAGGGGGLNTRRATAAQSTTSYSFFIEDAAAAAQDGVFDVHCMGLR